MSVDPLDFLMAKSTIPDLGSNLAPEEPLVGGSLSEDTQKPEITIGEDGKPVINFFKAILPALAGAGIGAAFGGKRGAAIGARSGLGYMEGFLGGKVRGQQMNEARQERTAKTLTEAKKAVRADLIERGKLAKSKNEFEALARESRRVNEGDLADFYDARVEAIEQAGIEAETQAEMDAQKITDLRISGDQMIVVRGDSKIEKFNLGDAAENNQKKLSEMFKTLMSQEQFAAASAVAGQMTGMPEGVVEGLQRSAEIKEQIFAVEEAERAAKAAGKGDIPAASQEKANILGKVSFQIGELAAAVDNLDPKYLGTFEGAVTEGKLDLGGMGLPLILTNFDTQLNDAIDSLLRVRSGAAVPPDEVAKFKKRMLGSFSSSPEALKLRMLQMQRQIDLEKAAREETGFTTMGPNIYLMNPKQLADYMDANPEDKTAEALAKMYVDAAGVK